MSGKAVRNARMAGKLVALTSGGGRDLRQRWQRTTDRLKSHISAGLVSGAM